MSEQNTPEEKLYCTFHPERETLLRCNRCNRPICNSCAKLTPTGYRCKECVRGQQKVFETATWVDFPIAILIAGGVSFLGSLFIPRFGFFTIFLAPVVGIGISEAVRWAVRKRRSKLLFQLAAAAAALAALPVALPNIIFTFVALSNGNALNLLSILLGLLWQVIYLALVSSTTYYRLSGINLKR